MPEPFDYEKYAEEITPVPFDYEAYANGIAPESFDYEKQAEQIDREKQYGVIRPQTTWEQIKGWSMDDAWESLTNAMQTVRATATAIGSKFEVPTWRQPLGLSAEDLTGLVRWLPGNEGLAPFEQQDLERQVLTVAQAASIPLVISGLVYQGITTIQGIRGWMRMNKAYLKDKFPTGKKLGVVTVERAPKWKEVSVVEKEITAKMIKVKDLPKGTAIPKVRDPRTGEMRPLGPEQYVKIPKEMKAPKVGKYTIRDGRLLTKKIYPTKKKIGYVPKAPEARPVTAETMKREAARLAALKRGAGVKTEEALRKLRVKTEQVKVVHREEFRDSLEEAIYEGLDAIPDATLSQTLKVGHAKTIASELTINLNETFTPKIAGAILNRAPRYVPRAFEKLEEPFVSIHENLEYDKKLWELQDTRAEPIPKQIENRVLGMNLEGAGDVFREIVGRHYIDFSYVGEKLARIRRNLDVGAVSAADEALVQKHLAVYNEMDVKTAKATIARELIRAVSQRDVEKISASLSKIEEFAQAPEVLTRRPAITNLHYLARYLDDAGIDRAGRNEVLNIIRDTKGEINEKQIKRIATDFLDSEVRKKGLLNYGERADLSNRYVELSDSINEAITKWRDVGKPKAEVADEALVLTTTKQRIELARLRKEVKMPPKQFLGFMNLLIGKMDIEKLTEPEAGILINAMQYAPRTKTSGQIKLSKMTDLIPSDYFLKKKRGVAFGMQLVPAHRILEWIGVKEEIYDPLEEAVVNKSVEEADKFNMFSEWRKQVGRSHAVAVKLSRYINGLLPDESMTPAELEVGGKIKVLMDEYADRMGLPLEKRKKNYMIHLFDAMTRYELGQANPLPDEALDALDFSVPKEIFARTLLHRLDRKKGLIEDIWKELRAVTAIDLRKIHLEPALQAARAYIHLGYKDEQGVMHPMPKTARDYIRNWINIAVLKKHAKLDDSINVLAKPMNDFMVKYTRGKLSMGANPAQTLAHATTSLGYAGAMTLNIAIAGKNLTQQFLIPPLLANPANYAKAWEFRFTDRGRMLLKESLTLRARFPMEMYDPKDIQKWLRYGMLPYRAADWLNVSQAFISGYLDALGQKMTYTEAIKYADRVAKVSQFSYRRPDMPEFMTKYGGLGRQAGQFQTWVANYWGNYMPELSYRLATGKGTDGKPVTLSQRAGLLSYVALTSAFIYAMYKYAKVDFRKIFGPGVIPTNFAPGVSLNLAIGQKLLGLATGDYRIARDANRKLSKSIPIFIPVDLQVEKFRDAYKQLTEGLERDSYGRVRRSVTAAEAIKGTIAYPAERSEFYRVQNKVWEIDLELGDLTKKLQNPTLTQKQREKLYDRGRKLSMDVLPYRRDLARLRKGLPAEETNQTFADQMKWIMLRR